MTHAQILPHHLLRKAVIYIRQSTGHQVLTNQESQKMQLAMKEHALRLGFPEERIEIVEMDTGTSAQSTVGRRGYKNLLSELALGEVGVVLSYESTRLSRNCSDWYPLLDLCTMNRCLIADRDGVYDPSTPNGRLLLGMKGIVSELELHTLRGRLNAGIENKARRGELCIPLPAGFVRMDNGTVVKDPDLQVQELVSLVFTEFLAKRTVLKVTRHFRSHGLLLPRQPIGEGRAVLRPASVAKVASILRNPAYAGAYVYGRTKTIHSTDPQRPGNVYRRCPRDQWRVVLKDRWPGYIDWDTFERIQAMLTDNYAEYKKQRSRGVPRQGVALLAGLCYCGNCGHKLVVRYPREARYVCDYLVLNHQHGKNCQNLLAEPIDRYVVQSFFEALSPIELDVYEQAQKRCNEQSEQVRSAQQRHLQRLRYEVNLARRQYDRADPDYRLVTQELERRWEEALAQLQQAEKQYERDQREMQAQLQRHLPPELRTAFTAAGKAIPELWPTLSDLRRKDLLRCLIDKVVLTRLETRDRLRVRIVWRGGADSETELSLGAARLQDLANYQTLKTRVLELAAEGKPDAEIATRLTTEGFRSSHRSQVTASTVQTIRRREQPRGQSREALAGSAGHPARARSGRRVGGKLSVSRMAGRLGVSPSWIYARLKSGVISLPPNQEYDMYLFPTDPQTLAKLSRLRDGLVNKVEVEWGHQDV